MNIGRVTNGYGVVSQQFGIQLDAADVITVDGTGNAKLPNIAKQIDLAAAALVYNYNRAVDLKTHGTKGLSDDMWFNAVWCYKAFNPGGKSHAQLVMNLYKKGVDPDMPHGQVFSK